MERVSRALRLTQEAGQPVTIHNAGQDSTGRSFRHGSAVLDLSPMTSISVDKARCDVTIGGGVPADRLNAAAGAVGLSAVIGNDGARGMAGFLMGGLEDEMREVTERLGRRNESTKGGLADAKGQRAFGHASVQNAFSEVGVPDVLCAASSCPHRRPKFALVFPHHLSGDLAQLRLRGFGDRRFHG